MSIDLEAIRARADAATEGEWGRYDRKDYGEILCCGKDGKYQSISLVQKTFDAEFIAHAREDIPALIAEVERLESEKAKAREIVKEIIALEAQHSNALSEIATARNNAISQNEQLKSEVKRLQSKLAIVTAERDAAVEDLTLSNTRKFNNPCEFCKKSGKNCAPVDIQDVCKAWEWRGERSE